MDILEDEKKTVLVNFIRALERKAILNVAKPLDKEVQMDLLTVAKTALNSGYELTEDDYKNTPNINLQHSLSKIDHKMAKNVRPKKAKEHNKVGNVALRKKDYHKALRFYTIAIANNPLSAYYCNRAEAYHCLGEYENAIEDCKRAIKGKPEYARAHNRMGLIHFCLKEFQEAMKCFKEANFFEIPNLVYMRNLEKARLQFLESQKEESLQVSIFAKETLTNAEKSLTSAEDTAMSETKPLKNLFSISAEVDDDDELINIFNLLKKNIPKSVSIPLKETNDDRDFNPAGPLYLI